ncbi:hypothetical protein CLV28_3078, partial [Sediminihabitans luteus]
APSRTAEPQRPEPGATSPTYQTQSPKSSPTLTPNQPPEPAPKRRNPSRRRTMRGWSHPRDRPPVSEPKSFAVSVPPCRADIQNITCPQPTTPNPPDVTAHTSGVSPRSRRSPRVRGLPHASPQVRPVAERAGPGPGPGPHANAGTESVIGPVFAASPGPSSSWPLGCRCPRPDREPTLADQVSNGCGGLLGAPCCGRLVRAAAPAPSAVAAHGRRTLAPASPEVAERARRTARGAQDSRPRSPRTSTSRARRAAWCRTDSCRTRAPGLPGRRRAGPHAMRENRPVRPTDRATARPGCQTVAPAGSVGRAAPLA